MSKLLYSIITWDKQKSWGPKLAWLQLGTVGVSRPGLSLRPKRRVVWVVATGVRSLVTMCPFSISYWRLEERCKLNHWICGCSTCARLFWHSANAHWPRLALQQHQQSLWTPTTLRQANVWKLHVRWLRCFDWPSHIPHEMEDGPKAIQLLKMGGHGPPSPSCADTLGCSSSTIKLK